MKTKCTLLFVILTLTLASETMAYADEDSKGQSDFFAAENWKVRLGVTDFQVEDIHTFGVSAGLKGKYEAANGIRLKMLVSVIADIDHEHLDPDHIPVWFNNYVKAEKDLISFTDSIGLQATLDFEHKMNTVSSIEQSADLMPGLKLVYTTHALELFAKYGTGGYYLEIDDDLPEIYSDYRREDLSNAQLAWFEEYKAKIAFAHRFTLSCRYRGFHESDLGTLETRAEIKFSYQFSLLKQLVLKAQKTSYNLDQFERAAGDNGLKVLPFDQDIFYQAYVEYDF